jgi:hypothetical protein
MNDEHRKRGYSYRVWSLRGLETLSLQKKSVICPRSGSFNRQLPAAFMIHQSGVLLLKLLFSGMYVYIPKKEREND